MKPRLIGKNFDQIYEYLLRMSRGFFGTRSVVSLTPVSVAANSAVEQTFSVPRLTTNESVLVACVGAQTVGIGIGGARVSAADTLAITFINPTAGALIPAAGDYRLIRITP